MMAPMHKFKFKQPLKEMIHCSMVRLVTAARFQQKKPWLYAHCTNIVKLEIFRIAFPAKGKRMTETCVLPKVKQFNSISARLFPVSYRYRVNFSQKRETNREFHAFITRVAYHLAFTVSRKRVNC